MNESTSEFEVNFMVPQNAEERSELVANCDQFDYLKHGQRWQKKLKEIQR